MRLWKSVARKTLNLLENLCCKGSRVTTGDHACLKCYTELRDSISAPLPGRDRATQLISLSRRKPCSNDRKFHGLLLKQRNSERLTEHLTNCLVGILNRLLARTSAKIRMNHVALDRSRPHDRNFHNEIVKTTRPKPWKHRHLGTRLNLKNSNRVGSTHHVVDPFIFGRNCVKAKLFWHDRWCLLCGIGTCHKMNRCRRDFWLELCGTDGGKITANRRRVRSRSPIDS